MNIDFVAKQLKIDEGFREFVYLDTVGKKTIGYGRNLDDVGISREEADFLLANDIKRSWHSLISALPWVESLPENQQHVLLNMTFNIGIGRLKGFVKMLEAVKNGNYVLASAEMLNSKWASQVGKRAIDLASLMSTIS